ncbi:MAG: hypothetical protein HZA46_14770 [Planctomycetales bacterium]|nr:hypothetical protein [Planctomycetales bacterium]
MLDWLEQALSADRRVEVLKARCQARLGQYAECSRILSSTFGSTEELKDVAGALHTAIVYCASGLFPAARDELETLCSRHQGLPSVWLFIGDVWQTVGRSDKAMQLWSTAAQNDYEPALIAPTARHRIREAIEEERLAPQKSLSQTR